MLLVIIFSFNRAMQLDYLLKSAINRIQSIEYDIAVIYHSTGDHSLGYLKIIDKYKKYKNIIFIERQSKKINFCSYLPTLYNFNNIYKFLKNTYFFNKNCDNFKFVLETLLKTTKCEFVMFNTDDGFYFDDVTFPSNILNLIRSDPYNTSYRLYVGDNLEEFPEYLKNINNEYYEWNYYEKKKVTHWTWPFAVDGTVYHIKSILKIMKKVFYHNPITLERYGKIYICSKKLMTRGLSPIKSKLICTKLNRVSTTTLNPTIHISIDYLNQKFIDGYEMILDLPKTIMNANIVPNNVYLVKGDDKELIYTFDEEGMKVQNSLGIEGAKVKF